MFYIWHTLIVLLFVAFSFFMGYKLGKSKSDTKEEVKRKCPMGFNWYGWRNIINGSTHTRI